MHLQATQRDSRHRQKGRRNRNIQRVIRRGIELLAHIGCFAFWIAGVQHIATGRVTGGVVSHHFGCQRCRIGADFLRQGLQRAGFLRAQ